MFSKTYSFEEMDAFAKEAELELEKLDQKSVEVVGNWWINWYMKAGHKRLGRILVRRFKKKKETTEQIEF